MTSRTTHNNTGLLPYRSFLEAGAEVGEAFGKVAIGSEFIKGLPVVGTMIKLAHGVGDVRSALLQRKLGQFLNEPALQATLKAEELRERLAGEDAQEVGEMLFMVIERVTDMTKPVLLARCFAAYLQGVIGQDAILMLAHCIDISHLSDLEKLIDRREPLHTKDDGLWNERLTSTGLFRTQIASVHDHSYAVHSVTPLCADFLKAVDHAEQLRTGTL